MTLAVEIQGSGRDLVLLHGWGMNRAVFSGLLPYLADSFCLYLVDLPGHGESAYNHQADLDAWAQAVLDVVPQNANWVGWSLGGLIAMRAAQLQPKAFDKLVLIASTPHFVSSTNWQDAVDEEVLQSFSEQLEKDSAHTLQRFLALQVMGSKQPAQTLRLLRTKLVEKPAPDARALQTGLSILRTADFRTALRDFPVLLYWLLGQRDTLVPASAAAQYPAIPSQVITGAGHAPFISHPEACAVHLKEWLGDGFTQVRHGS